MKITKIYINEWRKKNTDRNYLECDASWCWDVGQQCAVGAALDQKHFRKIIQLCIPRLPNVEYSMMGLGCWLLLWRRGCLRIRIVCMLYFYDKVDWCDSFKVYKTNVRWAARVTRYIKARVFTNREVASVKVYLIVDRRSNVERRTRQNSQMIKFKFRLLPIEIV